MPRRVERTSFERMTRSMVWEGVFVRSVYVHMEFGCDAGFSVM